jgi:hypothetical protein
MSFPLPVFGWTKIDANDYYCHNIVKIKESHQAQKICGYIPVLGSCIGLLHCMIALVIAVTHKQKWMKNFHVDAPYQLLLRGTLELFFFSLLLVAIDGLVSICQKETEEDYWDSSDSNSESSDLEI